MLFEIRTWEDLLCLENAIRQHMGCQGKSCAFLESAKYTRIRLDMIRQMNRVSSFCALPQDHFVYPSSNLVLHVKRDCSLVELKIIGEQQFVLPASGKNKSHEMEDVIERNMKRPRTTTPEQLFTTHP